MLVIVPRHYPIGVDCEDFSCHPIQAKNVCWLTGTSTLQTKTCVGLLAGLFVWLTLLVDTMCIRKFNPQPVCHPETLNRAQTVHLKLTRSRVPRSTFLLPVSLITNSYSQKFWSSCLQNPAPCSKSRCFPSIHPSIHPSIQSLALFHPHPEPSGNPLGSRTGTP